MFLSEFFGTIRRLVRRAPSDVTITTPHRNERVAFDISGGSLRVENATITGYGTVLKAKDTTLDIKDTIIK